MIDAGFFASPAWRVRRVISECRFSVQLNHFIPGFRSYSVAVFLKRQSDTTLPLALPPAWRVRRPRQRTRGGQTKYFLHGAPKNHDHYGLSRFCMDKH
jgi:hypothetical protein